MLNTVKECLRPVFLSALAVLAGNAEGCRPVQGPDPNDTYTMRTADCVAKATTRDESQACRAQVNLEYGLCKTERTDIPCPKSK